MKYGDDLIRLALGHPALIEEAQAVLDEANVILINQLRDYISMKISNLFEVSDISDENYDCAFWRPEWCQSQQKKLALFCLYWDGENKNNEYEGSWLRVLTGQSFATGCLAFKVDYSEIVDAKGRKIDARRWEKYLMKCYNDTQYFNNTEFIPSKDRKRIIIPIKLNASDLAENYPDNLEKCFGSVDSALEAIKTLLPEFDKIVQAVKNGVIESQ